jgi:hypothetical protein
LFKPFAFDLSPFALRLANSRAIGYTTLPFYENPDMANEWTPSSWRQCPAAHIPVYPDEAALQAVEQCLATYPRV